MLEPISFEQYKRYSYEEKLIHNFEMMNMIYAEVKEINGRVSKNEKWRHILTGGLIVVSAIIVPLFLNMVTK